MPTNLEDYKMSGNKGYITDLDIHNKLFGPERREELTKNIAESGTYLPKGVYEEDMDQSVIDYIKSDDGLSITIEGEKVPVIFLTLQRWSEFTKTWEFTDEYKDIQMPFITVIRNTDIQKGQNQAGLWNIPGNRTYAYMKVPTSDGVRHGVDVYKIPQPTSVDLTYEVRLFTNKLRHLNKFSRKIQRAFQSRQSYIDVNGHPMPLHLETINDETNSDFEDRRFYIQMFELKLYGYILDEEDFEVIPTINRTVSFVESIKPKFQTKDIVINGNFNFKFNQIKKQLIFTSDSNISFTEIFKKINIGEFTVVINGVEVFRTDTGQIITPIPIAIGDVVVVSIIGEQNKKGLLILKP